MSLHGCSPYLDLERLARLLRSQQKSLQGSKSHQRRGLVSSRQLLCSLGNRQSSCLNSCLHLHSSCVQATSHEAQHEVAVLLLELIGCVSQCAASQLSQQLSPAHANQAGELQHSKIRCRVPIKLYCCCQHGSWQQVTSCMCCCDQLLQDQSILGSKGTTYLDCLSACMLDASEDELAADMRA